MREINHVLIYANKLSNYRKFYIKIVVFFLNYIKKTHNCIKGRILGPLREALYVRFEGI